MRADEVFACVRQHRTICIDMICYEKLSRTAVGVCAISLLSACFPASSYLPVAGDKLQTSVTEVLPNARVVKLVDENVLQFAAEAATTPKTVSVPGHGSWEYRVGTGDVLKIIVWGVSELNDPSQYIEGAPAPGTVVQTDGTVFFPYIGSVAVSGQTVPQVREALTEGLSEYFPDPQVEVRVIEFKSQSAVVAGAVENPTRYPLRTNPTRLLDLVAQARLDPARADTERVLLRRNGEAYSINLDAFLSDGDRASNPLIIDGDTVFVPDRKPLEAFVLGEIKQASSIDISERSVSLTQILSEAGGLNIRDADARGIFVFRQERDGLTVFQLDVSNPGAYLIGTRFEIQAQDVVFVTTDPVSRWNRVISDLLPSVGLYQTVSDI